MKSSLHLVATVIAFVVFVQSAPVFTREQNPLPDQVPDTGHLEDDDSLPKGVPIPVKFHGNGPHFLLTQMTRKPEEGGSSSTKKMKAPEFPRGKGKHGETSRDTVLRELWEETGLRGKVDDVAFHVKDGNKPLVGHIVTVPVDLEAERNAETKNRINKWYHHSTVETVVKRPEMQDLFRHSMHRIQSGN